MSNPTTIYSTIPIPPDTSPERRLPLAAFIKANFTPRVGIAGVLVSGLTRQIVVQMEAWIDPNKQELLHLTETYLSNDLVTIRAASVACGVTIKRISAAVATGQLRGYINPDAPNPRKGRTLVSLSACRQMWGK